MDEKLLAKEEITKNLYKLPEWRLSKDGRAISREYMFKNFPDSIEFVNKISKISEDEGHHPDIHISYTKVVIEISTHSVNGLSLKDFHLAEKINSTK